MSDSKLEQLFSMIKCALSKDSDEHICEDPLLLSCSHWICKNCLPISVDCKTIICKICRRLNKHDLNEPFEPRLFQYILNMRIDDTFKIIYDEFKAKLQYFNDFLIESKESLESKIKFIKEQIQIRIESLKIEIDEIGESFINQLDNIKKNWSIELYLQKPKDFDIEMYFEELTALNNNIKNQTNLNQENMYVYQNKIRQLNDLISKLEKRIPKLKFEEIRDGSIHFHDTSNFNEIKKYSGHNGYIGNSKMCFYEYYKNDNNATLYCYNSNGELENHYQINGFNNGSGNGSILLLNSNLIVCDRYCSFMTI